MAGLFAPQFQDEEAARAHVEKILWPNGPVCAHCGSREMILLRKDPDYETHSRPGTYHCRTCRKQCTVTVGTIFEDSKIPLHKWLLAIHLMCSSKKGISAHQLWRNLWGVDPETGQQRGSYRTAWFMCHRIRWALGQEPLKDLLSGIVEIDETFIGGKIKPGRKPMRELDEERPTQPSALSNKAPVVSILQRNGEVRSQHVERVTAENLKAIVDQTVSPNAHLMTDTSTVLKSVGKGRKHDMVNHRADEYVRHEDGICITTNTVESYFAIIKRGNYGIFHHWGKHYTDQYLREFDFRYNGRKLDDDKRAQLALTKTAGKRLTLREPKGA